MSPIQYETSLTDPKPEPDFAEIYRTRYFCEFCYDFYAPEFDLLFEFNYLKIEDCLATL